MSERIEGLIEKTEKTIEGIVYAFGAYFRTLAALAFPFFLVRTFFLRTHRLRKRNLLAPPLVFLSISAFVFSIALAIIDTSKFIDPEAVVGGLKARANINISITELLFSIFPIFLWVWLLAWTGRLLVVHANRRKQVSRYFCYIFGFFSAAFFLWFLAWALMVSHYVQPRNIGQEHRGLPLGLRLSRL